MNTRETFDWATMPEAEALLRELWAKGVSSAEIARRIGVTKNAVVGKRRRIGLPERGSPIPISTKPKLPKADRECRVLPVAERIPYIIPREWRSHPCQMPIGDPREPGFRFCDAASQNGKVYCAACWQKTHIKRHAE